MDFELNEDETLLAEMAGKFAESCTPGECRRDDLAKMGWFGCHLPEAAGGSGLGMAGAAILMQTIGHAGVSDGIVGHAILAASALASSSTHAEPLARALSGDLKLGAALAEPEFRHDLSVQAATATTTAGGWRLDGLKAPVLGCADADLIVISANQGSDAPGLFAVPASTAGLTLAQIAGPDGRDIARLSLDGVIVPDACRLDTAPGGIAWLQSALQIALAAECCGAMQRLTEMTRAQLETRKQFGRAIGSFQALQHRFADMHVALDESRALMLAAAMASDAGAPEAATLARKAWIQACWSGQRIAEEAVQMHGAIGMTSECNVGYFVKRLTANMLIGGHADLHVDILADKAA